MTLVELYDKVLQKLTKSAAGEANAPEDVQLVAARYVSLYNLLNSEELVSWPVSGDLPDNVEIPVTTMLACHCAKEFGVTGPEYVELLSEGGMALPQMSWAERQLRRIQAKKYVQQRQSSEYF